MQLRSPLFPRSFRKPAVVANRGTGSFIWDADGNRYLDLCGSAAVNLIGHGHHGITAAMTAQGKQLEFAHTSQFVTPVAQAFARELLEFAGDAYAGGAVYFTCGGSEAVETAMKLARQYQVEIGQSQRYQIISQHQSYHGATLAALAVSGNVRRREPYLKMVREFGQVSIPYCYRCLYSCDDCAGKYAAELEDLLAQKGDEVAAFIFEPVSGATLGAAVPPPTYLQQIAHICSRFGVLLIADEVMTGFGRTGRNFAIDHWGIVPDLLVLGKGIASGYAPLGAVIAKSRVIDAIASGSGEFVHGFTYNAHPVSVAAGNAVLQFIRSEDLVSRVQQMGSKMREYLHRLAECDTVGDVRGIGLLWGIEFVADKFTKRPFPAVAQYASRVAARSLQRGISVYPMQGCVDGYQGDHLLLAPPAVISEADLAAAIAQLGAAIDQARP